MTVIAVQLVFGLMIAMFSGPGPAAIAEIFPTHSRSTLMPPPATARQPKYSRRFRNVHRDQPDQLDRFADFPTYYPIIAAIASAAAIATLKETAHEELR